MKPLFNQAGRLLAPPGGDAVHRTASDLIGLRQRHIEGFVLFAIMTLAIALRLTGLTWGIPTATMPHVPFHPDEAWAMSVMNEVDPAKLDFNPEEAHREGAFSYHLWTATALLLGATGSIEKPLPAIRAYDDDYRRLLLACRFVVVLCDLLCGYCWCGRSLGASRTTKRLARSRRRSSRSRRSK